MLLHRCIPYTAPNQENSVVLKQHLHEFHLKLNFLEIVDDQKRELGLVEKFMF